MRVADLIDAEVFDSTGAKLGRVNDVRLVQDGPLLGTWGAAFRVEGLVVGVGSFGSRLGFDRKDVRGPLALKSIFGRLRRRSHFVPWNRIAAIEESRVRIHGRASDYKPPDSIA